MVDCKVEDEWNNHFKMAYDVKLCAVPYKGCEILADGKIWEVRKVLITDFFVWLTVRLVGDDA